MSGDGHDQPGSVTLHVSRRAIRLAVVVAAAVAVAGAAFAVGRLTSADSRTTVSTTSSHHRISSPAKALRGPRRAPPAPSSTALPSATSTTRPAPVAVATTQAPTLPGAPPCDGYVNASSPKVRPASLVLACGDGNASISNITWTSWGESQAQGVGTFMENQCVPDCAQGSFVSFPNSSVELHDPLDASSVPVFQLVVVVPSGNVPGFTNSSPGAWGWG